MSLTLPTEPDPYPPADVDPAQLLALAEKLRMTVEPGEIPEWRYGPWPGWRITTRAQGSEGLQVFVCGEPCPYHADHDAAECEDVYPALTHLLRPVEWVEGWMEIEGGTPAQALEFALENGADLQPKKRSEYPPPNEEPF